MIGFNNSSNICTAFLNSSFKKGKIKAKWAVLFMLGISTLFSLTSYAQEQPHGSTGNQIADEQPQRPRFIINDIIVKGNKYVPAEAIINAVPEELAKERWYEAFYTSSLIRNVYGLNYFKQVHVLGEPLPNNRMNLYIVVEEKKRLEDVVFKGNDNLKEETIKKKISFNIPAVDQVELERLARRIEKLYREKDYHSVEVTPELEEHDDTATAIFNIKENPRSFVKRVFFKGNRHFSSKHLRKMIFTREDWLLSFMDKAGTYQPEAIEMDKHGIENFYQNHGYINAKVTDTNVVMDPVSKHYTVTFTVDEGELYRISEVHAEPHEHLTERMLLARIPVKPGDVYSREKLTKSMEILRLIWGEFGYIFADIIPSVEPDAESKTVKISFKSELGEKVHLRRLSIKGNRETRDKVIRRQLLLDEGDLITKQNMEESKGKVELLGYFDKKDGVNWKITRITDNLADLDLMVKEIKTGHAGIQLGVNPIGPRGIKSTNSSLTLAANVSKANLFGRGIVINAQGSASKEEYTAQFSIADPWLFDRPLYGGLDFTYAKSWYEEITSETGKVAEQILGGSGAIGYYTPVPGIGPMAIRMQLGGDYRGLRTPPAPQSLPIDERNEYQGILNRRFFKGSMGIMQWSFAQDARNHPMHPTRGYQWGFLTRLGFSERLTHKVDGQDINYSFGFIRFELNATWFTPLIDNDRLYLGLKGTAGFVRPISGRNIPFSELYNLGGPTTIRGFEPQEISPRWKPTGERGLGNILGGTNAFSWTAELMFPITENFTTKAYVFYDGGACWRTPDASCITPEFLKKNKFFYRHSVGVGVRLLKPTPITIDWGFKLNPQRKLGERLSEVHFSMYRDF